MSDDTRAGGATDGIAVSENVEMDDGARLYLEARGDHANAPLMIWLHGGPGGAERPLLRYFDGGLERRLLVAYYDQRGAGRSFDPATPAASLDIARHVADLDRIVDHLQSRHRHDRILLVGHSWGAALGMLFAEAHPEKVAGVVCVAPVVSPAEQHRREYAYDVAEAARRDDKNAQRELFEIGPPPYRTSRPVIRLQRVTERYRGVESFRACGDFERLVGRSDLAREP
ncbi:alpha/beta fold hydrolase [Methylosinus sp. H3A]|uniref:alpha/beta fold hydrolase n=1 Tax=Methylosinus sp. H3A TaxID=2785786 RepID=UPI0018C2C78E|nr:alpha/beta fold hydrolase [Methylosinus sp. H3A]MBG0808356.1 alpha/beta fold hydrolase [Methylosinus sp. H3A]